MYIVVREPQVGEQSIPHEKSSYMKPMVNSFDDGESAEAQKAYETACGGIGPVAMAKIPSDELWNLACDGIKWEDIIARPENVVAFNTAFKETFLIGKDNEDNGDNENKKPVKALTFAEWFKKNENFISRYERAVIEVRNSFEGYRDMMYITKPEKIYILLQIFGEYEMSKVQITGDGEGPCFRFVVGIDLGKRLDTHEG